MGNRYGESWRPCPEVCGGLFAVWEPNGAYNTIDTNVGAYNTVCVRAIVEHCSLRRIGCGPWYRGLTCALPSSFTPGPFRVGVPVGWPQSTLAAPVGEER